ncbi:BZ3500_MvSof-1268-A1-R1_Chr7-1g09181 [Microbotryum saponariae]|uniref:BZ3500_MvSof-1268-A1-R1_Chr7-1g09181 protein n=1 Tax=Microbotryum saponariae TaxID=289078 RepID=A0A2X0KWN5_9BASI|nr:BZ3501_MvSof-1269-A2-R1_Chr7-1g08886 [Microbotryum saponariae]SDA02950.1 BZ3500_MvSof-1268-A1-R1_Chr7-1g09181 [Microbotryum saponariae]
MPPKRNYIDTSQPKTTSHSQPVAKRYKRSHTSTPSSRRAVSRPIGAAGTGDDTSRLIAAHHQQEHALGGRSYLSVRDLPRVDRSGTINRVPTLVDSSLRVAARALMQTITLPSPAIAKGTNSPKRTSSSSVGWNPDRDAQASTPHLMALRESIQQLPSGIANRLLALVLRESTIEMERASTNENAGVSVSSVATYSSPRAGVFCSRPLTRAKFPRGQVLSLAALFLHPNTTKLSLSSLSAPTLLLSKIPQCTSLTDLDLSTHTQLTDPSVAKILGALPTLQRLNLRGCTKVGDAAIIALSKATESRLQSINLNLTAVTTKGLTALFARCSGLQVLKIANVQGLVRIAAVVLTQHSSQTNEKKFLQNDRNVTKLIDNSIHAALGWRHIPLSQLRCLKVRSTDITDNSLGRLLSLCTFTLERLDISFTGVKSLDLVSRALHTAPEWKLEKLVASGLPLTPVSLQSFFGPLAETRTEQERKRFKVLKLGSLPSTSTKQPGLTDAVLKGLMPSLVKLTGLESVSFCQNWALGLAREPMTSFISTIGIKCLSLDLTLLLQSHHLEGLEPPLDEDGFPSEEGYTRPKLQTLILNSSRIDDGASISIGYCHDLRTLHLAETKISTDFLAHLMKACPLLSNLNLTSCRGVPVAQRRTFFETWEREHEQ